VERLLARVFSKRRARLFRNRNVWKVGESLDLDWKSFENLSDFPQLPRIGRRDE
jgi:hypothetical protein